MASNTNKDYTQMHIKASDHPKAYAPHILILNIVMSILGAIIGLELIVRTGVAPNTSIVGALFAIVISRLPVCIFKEIPEYPLSEHDSDIYLRSNIFSSKLLPASNRCSGYHGQNGSYVSYACWCISCNHH